MTSTTWTTRTPTSSGEWGDGRLMGSLKAPRASGVSLLSEVDSAEMQAIFIIPSDWRVVKAKSAKIARFPR